MTSTSAAAPPEPTTATRGGGPGPGDILLLVRRHEHLTRAEIQRLTGYSRVTVGQRVTALVEAGLLREGEDRRSTGGRPSTTLQFNTDHGVFGVAALETTRMAVAVTDLSGAVLIATGLDLQVAAGPEPCLAAVGEAISGLLRDLALDRGHLRGIGISLPGPVHPVTLRPSEPPIMPGWDDFPVAERIGEDFGVPVVVENDANAMALGEHRDRSPQPGSLVLVKVSTGIGAGIVVNGALHQGIDGGAGDIGHTRVHGAEDALCLCGNHGCLAAVASGAAVARRLSSGGTALSTGHDVRALLDAGDGEAARAVELAGQRIGVVLAGMVTMLNPAVLVLSGDLASTALLGGVRTSLYGRTLPRATRHLEIVLGAPRSAARGLVAALLDSVFSPVAVDAELLP